MNPEIRRFRYNGEDTLSLPARRETFATLREWLTSIAEELGLPDQARKRLLIAADEIFTNIANYGYPAGDGDIRIAVAFNIGKMELELTFSDRGIPYNPLDAQAPDLTRPPQERKAGGLGIFLVKKLMDRVSYRREDGQNILVITKFLGEKGQK